MPSLPILDERVLSYLDEKSGGQELTTHKTLSLLIDAKSYHCFKAATNMICDMAASKDKTKHALAYKHASALVETANDVKIGDCNQLLFKLTQTQIADDILVENIIHSLAKRGTASSLNMIDSVIHEGPKKWPQYADMALTKLIFAKKTPKLKYNEFGYGLVRHFVNQESPEMIRKAYQYLSNSKSANANKEIDYLAPKSLEDIAIIVGKDNTPDAKRLVAAFMKRKKNNDDFINLSNLENLEDKLTRYVATTDDQADLRHIFGVAVNHLTESYVQPWRLINRIERSTPHALEHVQKVFSDVAAAGLEDRRPVFHFAVSLVHAQNDSTALGRVAARAGMEEKIRDFAQSHSQLNAA